MLHKTKYFMLEMHI